MYTHSAKLPVPAGSVGTVSYFLLLDAFFSYLYVSLREGVCVGMCCVWFHLSFPDAFIGVS